MPVPRQKLKESQRPSDERILEFLEREPDQAYTVTEIFARIENYDEDTLLLARVFGQGDRLLGEVTHALERLVQIGKVEKASYQGEQHYMIRQDV